MPPKKKTSSTFTTDWKSRKATKAALSTFLGGFASEMGEGVATMASAGKKTQIDVIPTGSMNLDLALGVGGWAMGRVHVLWGPEHSAKTTAAMMAVANAQRLYPNKVCGWVDMEQTFDEKWAETLGVDLDRLVIVKNPQSAEDVADAYKRMVMSGLFSVAVLDSIGGMISRREFEKEADESVVGTVAGIVTRMVKQVAPMARANDTCSLVINQVRANIGGYGSDRQMGGGWALKHISTTQCAFRRGDVKTITVAGKQVPVGHEVVVKVEKNKMSAYGRTGTFWLYNTKTAENKPGVDPIPEIVDVGKSLGVLEGSTWVTLPSGEQLNGTKKAVEYLRTHPDEVKDISERIMKTLATSALVDEPDEPDEPDEVTKAMIDFVSEAPFEKDPS